MPDINIKKSNDFFMHPLENVMKLNPIDGFSIDYRTLKKLKKFDNTIHFHKYYEIEFIFDGTGIHYLNGNSIPINRGYISLITPKDFHSFHLKEQEELKVFNIAFTNANVSKDLFEKILQLPYSIQGTLDEQTTYSLLYLFDLLFREFKNPSDNFQFIQRSLLDSIVSVIFGHIPFDNSQNIQYSKTVNEVLQCIEKEFTNPDLSLLAISENLHKTQNYLGRIIKTYTGLTFNQYINQKRLDFAKHLIKNKKLSIHNIAEQSGFSSTSYFIKLFKKEYGMTPNEYKFKRTSAAKDFNTP